MVQVKDFRQNLSEQPLQDPCLYMESLIARLRDGVWSMILVNETNLVAKKKISMSVKRL